MADAIFYWPQATEVDAYELEAALMDGLGWNKDRPGKLETDRKGCHAGRLLNIINSPGHRLWQYLSNVD